MMTIDDAITHIEEEAARLEKKAEALDKGRLLKSIEYRDCLKCIEEHHQLAYWLRELKQFRAESARMVDDGK